MEYWRDLKLKSCDILLCSGTGKLSKRIIWFNKLVGVEGEAAEISHVAMMGSVTTVVESTIFNKWAGKGGVQENLMRDWIQNYNGRVWARKLIFERTAEFIVKRTQVMDALIGTDYESGIPGFWELLLCGLRLHRVPSINNLHCSEVDVLTLQRLDLFHPHVLPNNFPPYTFWKDRMFEGSLLCKIEDPIRIK